MNGLFGIVDSEFIFLMLFHFTGWAFGDWDNVIGSMDSHCAFSGDFLVFEMINLVCLLVYLVF